MPTYNNYSISSAKGKLYLKEKQPTEGYEEILYGTDGKSKTYHKYSQSIKGVPTYFEQKEVQFDGRTLKFLELTLVDGEVNNKVSVSLKNKGGYTDEVKLLLSSLNGLDLGEDVTLSTAKSAYTNKKGEEKSQLNIYINYVNRLGENGKGLSTGYIPFGEIPKPTSKIVAGDTTWDWTEQTEFYYEKLTNILAKFQNKPEPQKTPLPPMSASAAFEPISTQDTKAEMQALPF